MKKKTEIYEEFGFEKCLSSGGGGWVNIGNGVQPPSMASIKIIEQAKVLIIHSDFLKNIYLDLCIIVWHFFFVSDLCNKWLNPGPIEVVENFAQFITLDNSARCPIKFVTIFIQLYLSNE